MKIHRAASVNDLPADIRAECKRLYMYWIRFATRLKKHALALHRSDAPVQMEPVPEPTNDDEPFVPTGSSDEPSAETAECSPLAVERVSATVRDFADWVTVLVVEPLERSSGSARRSP
jgi:hypothetical protein